MFKETPAKNPTIFETLSSEQQKIVTAHPDDNLLVLAPPGTGKTHTVIARIKYLIEEAGLDPDELLVLCFTRAAVGEIMQRIRNLIKDSQVHDDLRFVSVRTFDSYATRLLLSNDEAPPDLSQAGYDERIRMAIEALSDYESSAAYIVGECGHLIVDEIQDVVAIRAELVRAVLRLAAGGFTFLGDPAQAIYDFSAPEGETSKADLDMSNGSSDLTDWVLSQKWPGGLKVFELNHNYRSRGAIDKMGRTARKNVLNLEASDEDVYNALVNLIGATPEAGTGKSTNAELLNSGHDSVCILCRTNGELLQISSLLAEQGIQHYVRPRSTEYALPPWIGRVLGPSREHRLSSQQFEDLWSRQIGDQSEIDAGQAFRWLKRLEGRQRPTLDCRELQHRLYLGHRLPDDADASLTGFDGPLSISTIHSSKGREFDHVVVLTPNSSKEGLNKRADLREESRVLYVAATRARDVLSHLDREGLHGSMWVETLSNGRRRWVARRGCYYMEIGLPEDVDGHSCVSTYIHKHQGDAHRIQNMLWSQVRSGTPLYVHKEYRGKYTFFFVAPRRDSGLEQSDIAQLSRPFKDDLGELIKKFSKSERFSYPGYWTSARSVRVITEVLPPYPKNVHEPYASNGFCLSLRIRGLIPISE